MVDIDNYMSMSKLSFSDTERQRAISCVEQLIDGFCELSKIDTDNVPLLITVLDIKNEPRDDVPHKQFSRDEILSNAPEHDGEYFVVPKVL